MKALLNNNTIRKIAAVVLALLLWQAGAMAVNLPLLLVTPVEVVKRLFGLVLEGSSTGEFKEEARQPPSILAASLPF